jgi:hypothetical protein
MEIKLTSKEYPPLLADIYLSVESDDSEFYDKPFLIARNSYLNIMAIGPSISDLIEEAIASLDLTVDLYIIQAYPKVSPQLKEIIDRVRLIVDPSKRMGDHWYEPTEKETDVPTDFNTPIDEYMKDDENDSIDEWSRLSESAFEDWNSEEEDIAWTKIKKVE